MSSKTTTTTSTSTKIAPPFQIGHGVNNYKTTNAPSYGFINPCNTTEFDDELIKRGIVSYEQAMIAKGATPEDARRLHLLKKEIENPTFDNDSQCTIQKEEECTDDDDDDSFEDDYDDDNFLQQYRSKRMQELKEQTHNAYPYYGKVYHISRLEWKKEINEASCCKSSEEAATYVIVHLKYPYSQEIDTTINNLAMQYPHIKYVSINYREAITNFDSDNLPVIFVYYNGTLKHQDMQFDMSKDKYYIERTLNSWGIIDVQDEELLSVEEDSKVRCNDFKYKSRNSSFGGMATRFATQNNDDSIDYDDDDF